MNKQAMDEHQSLEKISVILLIMNKEDKRVYGMKGIGKYDEFETAEVRKENHWQFKQFDKNGSFLYDFLLNFFMEVQSPTRYKFFIVPQSQAVELAKKIQTRINNPSKEGEELLKKYELPTDHLPDRAMSLQKAIDSKMQQEKPKAPAKSKGRKM